MKVLLVDDSKTMRKILVGILRPAGFTDIVEAGDGADALKVVEMNKDMIGLVLMDWNMPNMNGLEALRALRLCGFRSPIIMVTTEAEKERILDAIKSGANDYVVKPFTQDIVMAKVQKALARFHADNN